MELKKDPIFGILTFKSTVKCPTSMHFLFEDDPRLLEFPRINPKVIKTAYHELTENRQNYQTALSKIEFDYPFRPDLIPCVISSAKTSKSDISKLDPKNEFQCLFILWTFITWQKLQNDQNENIVDHMSVIIQSLCSILDNPTFHEYSIRAIEHIFMTALSDLSKNDLEIISPIFIEFLKNKENYIIEIQSLLGQYLRSLLLKDSNETKNQKTSPNKSQNDFFHKHMNIITDYVNKNIDKLSPQTINEIISQITKKLTQLDLASLKLLEILSNSLSIETAVSLSMLFLMPIMSYIENSQPFLLPKDNENNEINIYDILKQRNHFEMPQFSINIKGQFHHREINTFKHGLDIKTALNFSDKPHLKSFIQSDLFEIILLIGKSFKNHENATFPLFDLLSRKITDSQNNFCHPHYFDFVSAYILLFKIWNNENLTKKFWNTLFNSLIFEVEYTVVINCASLNLSQLKIS